MNSDTTLAEAPPPPYSSFSNGMKRYIVFTAAGAGFFSSLSAQIYFPALNTLAEDLNVSTSLINLTVTSYMVCMPRLINQISCCYYLTKSSSELT
jgi:hypothetical protein